MCRLEFSSKTVFNFHLSQHKYLDSLNQIEQIKVTNNIKNSNNNKQYSIDAIVNSPAKCAKKTKLEDIASKISIKQQQTNSAFQNFQTALASLIQLSDKPEFNMQNSSIFGTNFSTLASNYNKLLNNTSDKNIGHQQMFNLAQPMSSSSSSFTPPSSTTNTNLSAFAIPNNNNNSAINPFLQNFNKQHNFYMNTLTNPAKSYNPYLNRPSNNTNFNPYKKLTIQTVTSTSKPPSVIKPQSLPLDFKCEFCGYAYKSLSDLVEHRAMHVSPNQKRPLRCHLCAIKFAKSEQLMKHMIVHKANGTDSICKLCFATFGRKQDLDRHMLFHSK